MWQRLSLGSAIASCALCLASATPAYAQETPQADDPPPAPPSPSSTAPETEPEDSQPAPQSEPLPTPSGPSTGRAPETVEGRVYLRPHRSLVVLGLGLFGIAFTASAIAGGVSDRPSDRWLLAPVVGPWIDLSKRDRSVRPCGSNDDVAKSFIVASGLVQAAGLGVLVWGLLVPEIIETRVVAPKQGSTVSITPTTLAGGAGVAALGTF